MFKIILILLLAINIYGNEKNYPKINVNQKNLKRIVKKLSKYNPERNYENLKALNKTAKFIESEFKKHNLEIEIQEFTVNKKKYKNKNPGACS